MERVKSLVRDIPDFPKPGIVFKDITPVLADASAMGTVMEAFGTAASPYSVDRILGIESRGFLFGTPLAMQLGVPFVPVRKPGKLPYETHRIEYELEYGSDSLEMHIDAVRPGESVIIVDDLLATGGTADAACRMVEDMGAKVAAVIVLIELEFLGGRARLSPRAVHGLIRY